MELNVLKGIYTTNSLKKVCLHGYGKQMTSLTVLESFVFLEELSIEIKWFKVSNSLAFSFHAKVFKPHDFIIWGDLSYIVWIAELQRKHGGNNIEYVLFIEGACKGLKF